MANVNNSNQTVAGAVDVKPQIGLNYIPFDASNPSQSMSEAAGAMDVDSVMKDPASGDGLSKKGLVMFIDNEIICVKHALCMKPRFEFFNFRPFNPFRIIYTNKFSVFFY